MSNRTMLEINHDYYPNTEFEEQAWLFNMLAYLRSGNPRNLPDGVTFFGMRHHSDPCPLGEPPHGWHNDAIGKYRADYSLISPEEIAAPDPELAEIEANSRSLPPSHRGGE